MKPRDTNYKTYLPGFDDMTNGGIVEGMNLLISGTPGAGKSIFALQYIYEGAKKGEPGVFVTFEQTAQDVKDQAYQFGWKIEELEKKNMMRIVESNILRKTDGLDIIKTAVDEIKAKRLVIDSVTTYATFIEIGEGKIGDYTNVEILDRIIPTPITSDLVTRMKVHNIMRDIKELKCTTLITSELPKESNWYSRDTISEFLADGIVILDHLPVIGKRTIKIIKLRWKGYEEGARTLDITSKGITIGKGGKGKLF